MTYLCSWDENSICLCVLLVTTFLSVQFPLFHTICLTLVNDSITLNTTLTPVAILAKSDQVPQPDQLFSHLVVRQTDLVIYLVKFVLNLIPTLLFALYFT